MRMKVKKRMDCIGLMCLFVSHYRVRVWVNLKAANSSLLASTIGPIDSGIVDVLENEFEKETGIRIRHVGAGTGAALKLQGKETSTW